ncbi:MAG: GAF domain-containing protein [Syntrophomonas sp.]
MDKNEAYYAQEEFVRTDQTNIYTIKSKIMESWKRCSTMGLNPHKDICFNPVENWQLNKLLIENKELIEIAGPFMYRLYEILQGSGFIIMLTNPEGNILKTFGDADNMEDARFVIGGCWQEKNVGTNSIGIVINTKEPVQVSEADHNCQKNHGWTCFAVPIFDNSNNMIGLFSLSGYSSEVHAHTMGLVVVAVEAIEQKIKIRWQNHQLCLMNKAAVLLNTSRRTIPL